LKLLRTQIALLEWSDSVHDLETVSIHTCERASQFVRLSILSIHIAHYLQQLALDSPLFCAELRVDSLLSCAALSLPKYALTIVPFLQTQVELDANALIYIVQSSR
jgi:cleavage and polyadenylation specificity factor subunit 1